MVNIKLFYYEICPIWWIFNYCTTKLVAYGEHVMKEIIEVVHDHMIDIMFLPPSAWDAVDEF